MADCDTLKASNDLRLLKTYSLLDSKGKGKATYYVPGSILVNTLSTQGDAINIEAGTLSTQADALSTHGSAFSTQTDAFSTQAGALSIKAGALNDKASALKIDNLLSELSPQIVNRIKKLKQKEKDKSKVRQIIKDVCSERYYTLVELSVIFNRTIKYISREYIKPMLDNGEMKYKYPEMIKHPDQAYRTL